MRAVLRALIQQIERENAEEATERYYADIKAKAAARRKANPGAYVMPPGYNQSEQTQPWCPVCGHLLSRPVDTFPCAPYHPTTSVEATSAKD